MAEIGCPSYTPILLLYSTFLISPLLFAALTLWLTISPILLLAPKFPPSATRSKV